MKSPTTAGKIQKNIYHFYIARVYRKYFYRFFRSILGSVFLHFDVTLLICPHTARTNYTSANLSINILHRNVRFRRAYPLPWCCLRHCGDLLEQGHCICIWRQRQRQRQRKEARLAAPLGAEAADAHAALGHHLPQPHLPQPPVGGQNTPTTT